MDALLKSLAMSSDLWSQEQSFKLQGYGLSQTSLLLPV